MKDVTNCERFAELVDQLEDPRLGAAELARVTAHAESCAACAALLRIREHFAEPDLETIEAAVPEKLVSEMWPRVAEATQRTGTGPIPLASPRKRWGAIRWLAAAAVVLIIGLTGGGAYLWGRNVELTQRERQLSERLDQQERHIESMVEIATASVARSHRDTPLLRLGGPFAGDEQISTGELRDRLAELPPDTRIMNSGELRTLGARLPRLRASAVGRSIAEYTASGGLQAGELLSLIDALDLDPSTRISARGLANLIGAAEALPSPKSKEGAR